MKSYPNCTKKEEDDKIYLNIDHLKKGEYKLEILLNKKVIQSIKIVK